MATWKAAMQITLANREAVNALKKQKEETDKLTKSNKEARQAMERTGQSTDRMGTSLVSLKRMVGAGLGMQLAGEFVRAARGMEGAAGKVVGAMGSIGQAAAGGAIFGPIGLAVGGSVAAIKELIPVLEEVTGITAAQANADALAAKHAKDHADGIKRKAERLQNLADAAREAVNWTREFIDSQDAAEGGRRGRNFDFQEKMEALKMEERRIRAGRLTGSDKISAERGIALDEAKGRHAAESARMEADSKAADDKAARWQRTVDKTQAEGLRILPNEHGKQAEHKARLEAEKQQLEAARKEAAKKQEELISFRAKSPKLLAQEQANINLEFGKRQADEGDRTATQRDQDREAAAARAEEVKKKATETAAKIKSQQAAEAAKIREQINRRLPAEDAPEDGKIRGATFAGSRPRGRSKLDTMSAMPGAQKRLQQLAANKDDATVLRFGKQALAALERIERNTQETARKQ
jgi:hypothetical protein